jgi:hypothetical protein
LVEREAKAVGWRWEDTAMGKRVLYACVGLLAMFVIYRDCLRLCPTCLGVHDTIPISSRGPMPPGGWGPPVRDPARICRTCGGSGVVRVSIESRAGEHLAYVWEAVTRIRE